MKMILQITSRIRRAFTLVELIIVLLIIAVMVSLTIPYASKSNDNLQGQKLCLDIKKTIGWAIATAEDTKKCTRLVVSEKNKYYLVEAAAGDYFERIDDNLLGGEKFFGQFIMYFECENFSRDGEICFIEFDPEKDWPKGEIKFFGNNFCKTVIFNGRKIGIVNEI